MQNHRHQERAFHQKEYRHSRHRDFVPYDQSSLDDQAGEIRALINRTRRGRLEFQGDLKARVGSYTAGKQKCSNTRRRNADYNL
jgi:hypothetical protein